MGLADGKIPAEMRERFDACKAQCERSAHVRGIARSFPARIDADSRSIHLEGTQLDLPGDSIAEHLRDCPYVTLFAVTLGMDNERALNRAQALGALDGLIVDACSSSLAEEASVCAARTIEELAREARCETTKRFSPGYGDLPLDVQPALLSALQADRLLGIHVGSSQLMTPMKSVTAIIGLKPVSENGAPTVNSQERH